MAHRRARIRSPHDFGLAIQQARLGREWSQRDLAEKAGYPQSVISDMENGKHTRYAERLFELLSECEIAIHAEWDDTE
ncbi:helix-turn-helix transcriptional regulator [Nocardia speluncae]|uniref:Helix-turn-helix transcriptional regulator n=1 Tax=Nocardia speluncae TaxID=419477 RepID=A0A846XPE5_9NOCA|nr:helix-turn-helix transcriptional regulator [Nocardia speluncae]NKY37165.1 helix-turn-helix transcriptional regulator [Nocardia speluncae]